MIRRLLSVFATLALASMGGALQACNRYGCDGQAYEAKASNPLISSMSLVSQQAGNPWYTIFSITFKADAADLGGGTALQYYNANSSPRTTPLASLMEASQLDGNATEGVFFLPVYFNNSIQDGDTVRLGTQLKGAGGGMSNCFEMDLMFSVSPVTAGLVEKSSLWAGHLFDVVRRDLLKTRG